MPQSLQNSLKLWLLNWGPLSVKISWGSVIWLSASVILDPEASDYVGPQEFADLEVCYLAECLCFDPFGEVVSDYQKEDLLPRRHREFPYYVHAPLSEGPW